MNKSKPLHWYHWGAGLGLWLLAAFLQAWPWRWGDEWLAMPWLLVVLWYGFDRRWPGMVWIMCLSGLLMDVAYHWPLGQTLLIWLPLCWLYATFGPHLRSRPMMTRILVALCLLALHQAAAIKYWHFPAIIQQYSVAIVPPLLLLSFLMRGFSVSCQKKY